MDGLSNNTFADAAPTPTAPPPPVEVKVRTMQSDLAAMAKSGGGLPTFSTVKIGDARITEGSTSSGGSRNILIGVIVIAAIAAAALIGYVVYTSVVK